jgi:hypothetical protein
VRAFQNTFFRYGVIMAIVLALMVGAAWAQLESTGADTTSTVPTADEDVPYGVAAGYIMGHKLLQEGKAVDALPYLHMAYRAQPEVVDIALDFQSALAAQGYFKDALEVVNQLYVFYPDSLSFLVERVNLNLKSGENARALQDLHHLREQGYVTFPLVDAEASLLMMNILTEEALDVFRD